MSDRLIQGSFLSFARYYYEQTLETELKVPEMSTTLRNVILSTYRDDYGLSERHWLHLNSDPSKRAMVIAAVGWILECQGFTVHYYRSDTDVKLYINETQYDLMHPAGLPIDSSTSRVYEVVGAEAFFNSYLLHYPEEVDYIAAFTIAKRFALYPFEPII